MDYSTAPASISTDYVADRGRYDAGGWRGVGATGLKISPITVGTWQNFSDLDPRESVRELYLSAFDHGIFAFDFGNNYGRPPGSAEAMFGGFITRELMPYRRELIISTKAGYDMWPGPNGVGSSLKYLISSLDESLRRLRLDYVDIFFSHRYDPSVPIEETAEALDLARRSGRCLYVGISSYPADKAREIGEALSRRGTSLAMNQSHYNMLSRDVESGLFDVCRGQGVGFAAFSPLAQGLLSETYLEAGNEGAGRAGKLGASTYCNDWEGLRSALRGFRDLAHQRGQTIPQLALSWTLRDPVVCTTVIGVRTREQLLNNLKLDAEFSAEELVELTRLGSGLDVNLWKSPSGT